MTAPEPDPVIAAVPVGSEIDVLVGRWGLATATFNSTRTHRFRLSRVWDESLPRLNFVMLNPSKADAFSVDPTVRRCLGFARDWGYGSVEVTNVFAIRTTYPRELRSSGDPVGEDNDNAIHSAAVAAAMVIAAWGVHATYRQRDAAVLSLLRRAGVTVWTLHRTKNDQPGHPLYLPSTARPVVWP